jgi:hypothetical protein
VTPRDRPFILHAAEGIDAGAAAELTTLEEWGCLRDNTVLWYCSDNGALPNVGSSGGRRCTRSVVDRHRKRFKLL